MYNIGMSKGMIDMKNADTNQSGTAHHSGSKTAVNAGKPGTSISATGNAVQYGTFLTPRSEDKSLMQASSSQAASDVPLVSQQTSKHTNRFIYCSHFLSAWGDRMWSFGVGLFLVGIAGNNLQLPATYGLASGLTIFLLGALLGDWVDSTPRLKAAQLSIVLQNLLVVVCSIGVYAYIHFEPFIAAVPGGWSVPLCHTAIIILAVLADLTSLARVIAVERDWIVKICGTDTDKLTAMTAKLRCIDQTTLVLAPIAVGQVMTLAGLQNGALFIGAWNLSSLGVEYYLLWKVFVTVPSLSQKQSADNQKDGNRTATVSEASLNPQTISDEARLLSPSLQPTRISPDSLAVESTPHWNENSNQFKSHGQGKTKVADTEILLDESDDQKINHKNKGWPHQCCGRVLYHLLTLQRGWRTYMIYNVALAGLSLACLYVTVLSFGNITVAYAVTQGVSEAILGILMGISAMFGLLGTVIYPILQRRVGLVRTALIALSSEVCCLALCVVSVWLPGSPFDPTYSKEPAVIPDVNNTSLLTFQMERAEWWTVSTLSQVSLQADLMNISLALRTLTTRSTTAVSSTVNFPLINPSMKTLPFSPTFSSAEMESATEVFTGILRTLVTPGDRLQETVTSLMPMPSPGSNVTAEDSGSYMSIAFLMAGIVSSRFGLWTADLAITQLFLEVVAEKERGLVSGVQNSLNQLMEVLKYLLVVAIPDVETFGFLIIISFSFVSLAWLLYAVFLRKNRGHFFHCF